MTVKLVSWEQQQPDIRAIRSAVFIDEQKVPIELEWDDQDESALHWLVFENDQAIATCRMLIDGHIGRMAVLKGYRNKGVGKILLESVITTAKNNQLFQVYLNAQKHAISFYEKSGFVVHGEEFMDAGIPHYPMQLTLQKRRELGVHGGRFSVKDLAQTTLDLASQATQQLRILSFDLNPHIYDNAEMEGAVSSLSRKNRYTHVKILIVDPSLMLQRGHRLLRLQRRLSSSIELRTVNSQPHEIKENLIIADRTGLIYQSINDTKNVWANFNNQPVTSNYATQFDELWARSHVDVRLRQLDL